MGRKEKDFIVRKSFKYKDKYNEYTLQLKHHHWWWLSLLLLPLLFIRCTHDIKVTAVDEFDGNPLCDITIQLGYTSHVLLKNGSLLCHRNNYLEQITDSMGTAYFRNMETSVFAYIFYCLSNAHIKVDGGKCFEIKEEEVTCNFHYTYHKQLIIANKRDDVKVFVRDVEMKTPIAGARLHYSYRHYGHLITDTVISDPTGEIIIPHVPMCGKIDTIFSRCHGYIDTLVVSRQFEDIVSNKDSATVYMRALKESFTFFVKDKESREPIPGATAFVTLSFDRKMTNPAITTNVDGQGRGTYKNAPIVAHLSIHAKANHYKNGDLEGNPTIEEFIVLPDNQRVVWLESLPWTEQFQDIDSITGKPVAGAKNFVRVTDGAKDIHAETQVSNSHGYFRVEAKAGNKIEITAEKVPDYITKDTVIQNFSKTEVIRMTPDYVSLTFKTVEEDGSLVPNCTLNITATSSGASNPKISGTGEFTIPNLLGTDILTIISSKAGYETNSTTINCREVMSLLCSANPHDFEIPMKRYLPPCDAGNQGQNEVKAGSVSQPQSYNMGANHGTFDIIYDTGTNCPDCIDIYNHKLGDSYLSGHKIWSSGQVVTGSPRKASISFSYGSVITVVVTTGPSDGSLWNYHITCPY